MTPEAASHFAVAELELAEAKRALDYRLIRMAARAAYYATFRAAEALVVERTGKVAKTHNGVRAEFARIWQSTPDVDQSLTKVLPHGYRMKETVDYGFGLADVVSDLGAAALLADAERFITAVRAELERPPAWFLP